MNPFRRAAEGFRRRWVRRGQRLPRRERVLSDRISVFDDPPALDLSDRAHAITRYLDGLRETLVRYPDGWSGPDDEERDLAARVASRLWYHTIELPGVTTPGHFDHRPVVSHYGLPENLAGKRVLDIGTWDGFWAFEFERRGASVVAVDVDRLSQTDLPEGLRKAIVGAGLDQRFGGGFSVACAALGSNVERVACSIYDLSQEQLGVFDLVHVGDVLQHLEYPTLALRRVRSVTAGWAIIGVTITPEIGDVGLRYRGGWHNVVWWNFSAEAAGQMVVDAGFSDVRLHGLYRIRAVNGVVAWQAVFHARP